MRRSRWRFTTRPLYSLFFTLFSELQENQSTSQLVVKSLERRIVHTNERLLLHTLLLLEFSGKRSSGDKFESWKLFYLKIRQNNTWTEVLTYLGVCAPCRPARCWRDVFSPAAVWEKSHIQEASFDRMPANVKATTGSGAAVDILSDTKGNVWRYTAHFVF